MFFSKLKDNLTKTKEAIEDKLNNIFNKNKQIDEVIDDIEEALILSDVGYETSVKICDVLRKKIKGEAIKDEETVKRLLKEEIVNILNISKDSNIEEIKNKKVILVVGVNGVGKTTSIGKIANLYREQGNKVLLAAGDTFRAGAIEQLDIWAKRANVDICLGKENEDPSSVIFNASKQYIDENYDILICDTAGRLHNKKNLMDELEKIKRTLSKNIQDIQIEVLMVLDATTGQNAISQVKNFFEKTCVDGLILTKLDSTAKGGVILAIVSELNIPVKYIGIGEKMEDIEFFDAKVFADALI